MAWTDERIARLEKLWADGLTASQIAAELGGVTRNAVIGKKDRLSLPLRGKLSVKKPKRLNGSKVTAPGPSRKKLYGNKLEVHKKGTYTESDAGKDPDDGTSKDLMEQDESNNCSFIYNDSGRYCGVQVNGWKPPLYM